MKSIKSLLFVLAFSMTLLAGCASTITEAPAEDAAMGDAVTVHGEVDADEAMEAEDAMMEDTDVEAMEEETK